MKPILEHVQVGDWVCCDHAQPDLRCRQVVKRTPSRVWTNLREDPFRLDGTRYKSDSYPVRPATPKDLAAWEAAKSIAKARQVDAENRRRENARKERIRDAAEDLLTSCQSLCAWLERHHEKGEFNVKIDAALSQAKAAIAKATGGPS
jgi:hypothetical protein